METDERLQGVFSCRRLLCWAMFNVKWFGAKGDGVFANDATDKAAIQAAIDACAAAGAAGLSFYHPVGTCAMTLPATVCT